MAEKLKLVRELIPWSLVARAALFGVSWLYLPYFLFVGVAAYLFISPPFQILRFSPLFLLILWCGAFFSPTIPQAVLLSFLFFVLLGMKNLVFVDRVLVAEVFLVIVSFLLWYAFFTAGLWPSFFFFFQLLTVLLAHFLLLRFITRFENTKTIAPGLLVLSWVFCFLSFELAWLVSLLPLRPVLQALLLALFTALFLETYPLYVTHSLNEQKIIRVSLVVIGVLVVTILLIPFSLGV